MTPEGDDVGRTLGTKGTPRLGQVPLIFNLYAHNVLSEF